MEVLIFIAIEIVKPALITLTITSTIIASAIIISTIWEA